MFCDILNAVQNARADQRCKHGNLLCECMEDCIVCFAEALEKFKEATL